MTDIVDMIDQIEILQQELDSARCELEELSECGDLEDRLDAAQRVSDLERAIESHRFEETGGR
jgi:hypothetical protein